MKVLVITWPGHKWIRERMDAGLMRWHRERGDEIRFSNLRIPPSGYREHFGRPDLVYIHNGEYDEAAPIRAHLASLGVTIKFYELGWFPQSQHWYFDPRGTNGNASIHHDPLEWVTAADFERLHALRAAHYGDARWKGDRGAPILVALQLDHDTAVQKFGLGFRNQSLLVKIGERFPGRPVVVRPHPLDKNPGRYQLPSGASIENPRERPLVEALTSASRVIGINSTVLLEAALLGVPVEHVGQCFLDHPAGVPRLLAALAAKQVPNRSHELDAWMHPHLGLDQPSPKPRK